MDKPLAQQVLSELDPKLEADITGTPGDKDMDGHADMVKEMKMMEKCMMEAASHGDKVMEMAGEDGYIDEKEYKMMETMKGYKESMDKSMGMMEKMYKKK